MGIRDTALVKDAEEEQLIDLELEASIYSILTDSSHRADFSLGCYDNSSRGLRTAEDEYNSRSLAPRGILASTTVGNWRERTKYFDEVTHVELPAELVEAARAEEVEYLHTLPV